MIRFRHYEAEYEKLKVAKLNTGEDDILYLAKKIKIKRQMTKRKKGETALTSQE